MEPQQALLTDQVQIPYELLEWAETEEGNNTVDGVRDKSKCIDIKHIAQRQGRAAYVISAATDTQRRAARSLLELHLQYQIEYQQRKTKREKVQSDLEATNREFKEGLRVEFTVDQSLIGLVIGKNGANVTKVKEITGVDKIIVDTKTHVVRIKGKDAESVSNARSMLEFSELAMKIPLQQIASLIGGNGKSINDIWKKSGCVRVHVDDIAYTKSKTNEQFKLLKIVGTKGAVELGRELVETLLDFDKKFKELRGDEESIQKQLQQIDINYRDIGGGGYYGRNSYTRRYSQDSVKSTDTSNMKKNGSSKENAAMPTNKGNRSEHNNNHLSRESQQQSNNKESQQQNNKNPFHAQQKRIQREGKSIAKTEKQQNKPQNEQPETEETKLEDNRVEEKRVSKKKSKLGKNQQKKEKSQRRNSDNMQNERPQASNNRTQDSKNKPQAKSTKSKPSKNKPEANSNKVRTSNNKPQVIQEQTDTSRKQKQKKKKDIKEKEKVVEKKASNGRENGNNSKRNNNMEESKKDDSEKLQHANTSRVKSNKTQTENSKKKSSVPANRNKSQAEANKNRKKNTNKNKQNKAQKDLTRENKPQPNIKKKSKEPDDDVRYEKDLTKTKKTHAKNSNSQIETIKSKGKPKSEDKTELGNNEKARSKPVRPSRKSSETIPTPDQKSGLSTEESIQTKRDFRKSNTSRSRKKKPVKQT